MKRKRTNAIIYDLVTKKSRRVYIDEQIPIYTGKGKLGKLILRGFLITTIKPLKLFGIRFTQHKKSRKTFAPFGLVFGIWKGWKNRPVIIKEDGKKKRPMLLLEPREILTDKKVPITLMDIGNIEFLKEFAKFSKKKKKFKRNNITKIMKELIRSAL